LSAAQERATAAESEAQYRALLIEKLKFTIRKLRHERFGQSSERGTLLDQLELQLADLEEDAAQAEAATQMAAAAREKITVPSFERRRPARRPLPEHLPRERIVYPAPSACPCCGGTTLRKIGEDVTETLELIPRQWKVIQHIREKFSCRACEAISQPPAPSHPIARGREGPKPGQAEERSPGKACGAKSRDGIRRSHWALDRADRAQGNGSTLENFRADLLCDQESEPERRLLAAGRSFSSWRVGCASSAPGSPRTATPAISV
jgi:hypothetical protein